MQRTVTLTSLIVFLFFSTTFLFGQNNFWSDVTVAPKLNKQRQGIPLPARFRTLKLDTAGLKTVLKTAPKESGTIGRSAGLILTLPMPDGAFSRFRIVESIIMEEGLSHQFPAIKTYSGQGIDDPYATIKADWTELGFHAMITSPVSGSVFVDPVSVYEKVEYISYLKKDVTPRRFIEDGVLNISTAKRETSQQGALNGQCIGGTLRQYRLAVACTAEYARAIGGDSVTKAQALSAIVTTVNRVDGVYETEADIRLVLVANNAEIVFTDPATQPFSGNDDANQLIEESQTVITKRIGSANFDIGHTFSTGAGGLAALGVVCNDAYKAMGVTGSPKPVGDAYDIDYVAHEIGHQFAANHTFNASTAACAGNGVDTTNAEPGSGSTIMAYAGICGAQNDLQPNSSPQLHPISLNEISAYSINAAGNNCAVKSATGNNPPVVNAGANYIIPKSTPFVLTGSATDPDNDALTYSWDEMNVGAAFSNWNNPAGNAPIFRSFPPVTTPVRYFPKLSDILNNTTTIGELLPTYGRTLKFRLTARDNRAGGGGVCFGDISVNVDGTSGPFVVRYPNTAVTWTAGTFETITWDVAKTNQAPVSCQTVAIELSTDGGQTFPVTLAGNTSNDGREEVVVPNHATANARVRIRAVGNVFFDVSNTNFSIQSSSEIGFAFSNPQPVISCSTSSVSTVLNTSSLNGSVIPIVLSATGNPAGTNVVFSNNPILPGSTTTVTLQGTIPPGTYKVVVTGTSGTVNKTREIIFAIGAPTIAPVVTRPANNSIGQPILTPFSWQPVANAQSYSLQISPTSSFASLVQSVNNITDTGYTLTTPLAYNTAYYWRVAAANSCSVSPGPNSASNLFKTVAIICSDTMYSHDVPLKIDTVASTTISTLYIPTSGFITDVDVVGVRGNHTYFSDLSASIVSPSGTEVILFSNTCDSSGKFYINFDDNAASSNIACLSASPQTVKPRQALSALNNQNSAGTWYLWMYDNADGDGGSLDGWGLRLCTYAATALPVNWLSFTGKKSGNGVVLNWSTSSDINNAYYEIERSSDGINFNTIGKIAAGTAIAGAMQQFVYNDARPLLGSNYYRLKQVDKDGKISYSIIVRVQIDNSPLQYIVYPNPASDNCTVRFLAKANALTITLTDVAGRVVYRKGLTLVRAGEQLLIPVKQLNKGLYLLTLQSDAATSTEKVLIQE